jgi:hypothetical protein
VTESLIGCFGFDPADIPKPSCAVGQFFPYPLPPSLSKSPPRCVVLKYNIQCPIGGGRTKHEREKIMSARPRDILLSVTLAAAVTMPALAQTVDPPVVGAAPSGAQKAASIPDFSGMWAHPYLPGFEPPATGPGPVLNRSRSRSGRANFSQLVGDYTNPILRPEAAEIVKKHGEMSLAGEGYPTPSNQCWPGGVPYIFWDYLMQMFQQPDSITMIYRHGNEVRRVRMNQPHQLEVTPSWYGDSVGHYEDDTLVIDTVGIKIGPFAMVDMYGTPHSPALHVVERYRLLDYEDAKQALERNEKENARGVYSDFDPNYRGKVLQLHFMVEDEGVFTTPWTATITYRPALGSWTELICAENLREPTARKESAVPTANKPDF